MQHNWIFSLKHPISDSTAAQLQSQLDALMLDWKAHGTPVPGNAEIRHQRFVLVTAEPGSTSGCSIDSMTHGVEKIVESAGVEILPNNFICYRNSAGDISEVDFREVRDAIQAGQLGPETTIFDASLHEGGFENFEKQLSESWLARFLPARTV